MVITLVVIGVLWWLLEKYVPINRTIKNIIYVVVVICVAVWLLNAFGIWHHANDVKVPQL
jgi:hypothetical protein